MGDKYLYDKDGDYVGKISDDSPSSDSPEDTGKESIWLCVTVLLTCWFPIFGPILGWFLLFLAVMFYNDPSSVMKEKYMPLSKRFLWAAFALNCLMTWLVLIRWIIDPSARF